MDLLKLGVDPKYLKGEWVDYIHPMTELPVPGVKLKIASSEGDEYKLALARTMSQMANANLKGNKREVIPGPDKTIPAEIHAMARYILLDFQGIDDGEGKKLDGSLIGHRERVLEITLVRDFVAFHAKQIGLVVVEEQEEDLGNSKSGAGGTSDATSQNG